MSWDELVVESQKKIITHKIELNIANISEQGRYPETPYPLIKDNVGDVMGDLNSRRGKVMGMDSDAKAEIINAQVPQAEIQSYATDLTSMTGGLGTFTVEFSHYEDVPAQIAEKIIAKSKE